ncbi:MAG TPA: metal ABC transporter substrate-binding protein [Candidatus Limnocylindrales bacterium]|nr:metal ABC transporter substrate-binding protein [Candidatus Limnocylindrales bacterium]
MIHLAPARTAGLSRRPHRLAAAVLAGALVGTLLAACGGSGAPTASAVPGALQVVTTTTILADMVHQVGGERVSVNSLVPRGGEVHTFDPTPADVRRLAAADLVFINGLGLDEWLANLVADTGTRAPVVRLAEKLEGVDYLAGGGEGTEAVNPHLWLNVAYAAKYAERIAGSLAAADPDHAADYQAGYTAYAKVLGDLDTMAAATLGAIPEANRTVISFHDAFPYFAAAYGLTIDGTIVNAPGQDPSAAQVSGLIRLVKEQGIKAIFAEAQFSEDLVRTIADETGATVVSDLYTDSVGDAPQDTYAGMMTWNVEQVAKALTGS